MNYDSEAFEITGCDGCVLASFAGFEACYASMLCFPIFSLQCCAMLRCDSSVEGKPLWKPRYLVSARSAFRTGNESVNAEQKIPPWSSNAELEFPVGRE